MKRIKICEFRAQNNINKPLVQIEVAEEGGSFYYINSKGDLSTRYGSIKEAVNDLAESYSNWNSFRLLV